MTTLLQAQGLEAGYGAFKALFGVSLRVEEGEAVGIIGSNGAGKTTLLRALAGWLPLGAGQVHLGGRSLADILPEQVVAHGLALVPEGRRLIPRMSVEDNLRLGAATSLPRAELARRLDEVFALFPKLLERRRQLAGTMSGGEQQMCAVGRALMSRPRILLLDEPSAGLAPAIVDQMFEFVRELRRRGMTILLVEQHIPQLLRSVDRLYAMEGGRICHEATAAAVAADRSSIERMIGLHGRSVSA